MNKITVVRAEHFNAAHRLHNDNWSEKKTKLFLGNVITLTIMGITMI